MCSKNHDSLGFFLLCPTIICYGSCCWYLHSLSTNKFVLAHADTNKVYWQCFSKVYLRPLTFFLMQWCLRNPGAFCVFFFLAASDSLDLSTIQGTGCTAGIFTTTQVAQLHWGSHWNRAVLVFKCLSGYTLKSLFVEVESGSHWNSGELPGMKSNFLLCNEHIEHIEKLRLLPVEVFLAVSQHVAGIKFTTKV